MQDAGISAVVADDVDERFAQLLDRVEHGEEILLTRQGRAVARLVPTDPTPSTQDSTAANCALQELFALGDRLAAAGRGPFTLDDILAARHEVHRY